MKRVPSSLDLKCSSNCRLSGLAVLEGSSILSNALGFRFTATSVNGVRIQIMLQFLKISWERKLENDHFQHTYKQSCTCSKHYDNLQGEMFGNFI